MLLARQAHRGARPVADRRRHQVPRPVRGAPQGHHQGAPGASEIILFIDEIHSLIGAGSAGGLARRREHSQARPVPRRDLLHRRHDAARVPQVRREGPRPVAPLPGDPESTRPTRRRPSILQGCSPLRGLPRGPYTASPAAAISPLESLHPDRAFPDKAIDVIDEAGAAGQAAPGRAPRPAPRPA